MKKKTPTEVLEKVDNPSLEHSYLKIPRNNPQEVTLKHSEHYVISDPQKIEKILSKSGVQNYTKIHNHPKDEEFDNGFPILPSYEDLSSFMNHSKEKMMMIAEQDSRSGKVEGYLAIRKTNKTPQKNGFKLIQDLQDYGRQSYFEEPTLLRKIIRAVYPKSYSITNYNPENEKFLLKRKKPNAEAEIQALQNFSKKYNLQYRFIPSKENVYDPKVGFRKDSGIESKIPYLIFAIFWLGVFPIYATKITGGIIGVSQGSINLFLGFLLFLLSIAIFLRYTKRRNKKYL